MRVDGSVYLDHGVILARSKRAMVASDVAGISVAFRNLLFHHRNPCDATCRCLGDRVIGACVVGFVGVLFVIQPSFAAFGAVALIPLGTAVAFAFYILVTRGLSRRMHPVALQFHTGLIASLFCIPVLLLAQGSGSELFDPIWPKGIAWLWLFGAGLFAAVRRELLPDCW